MKHKFCGLLRLNRDDFLLIFLVGLAVCALTHAITAIALEVTGETSSILISGVFLPCVLGGVVLILTVNNLRLLYNQGLRFSQTRRGLVPRLMALFGLEALFAALVAALFIWGEKKFAPPFWLWLTGLEEAVFGPIPPTPEGTMVLPPTTVLHIEEFTMGHWGLLVPLGCALIGVSLGALVQRFGSKGLWALWALWMGGVILFPNLPWQTHEVTNVLIPLLVLVGLAWVLWAVWYLLRAPVS